METESNNGYRKRRKPSEDEATKSFIFGTPLSSRIIRADLSKIPENVFCRVPHSWKDWNWYLIFSKEEDWLSADIAYSDKPKDYFVVKKNVDKYYELVNRTIYQYFSRKFDTPEMGIRIKGSQIPRVEEELLVAKNHEYWLVDLENLTTWYDEGCPHKKKARDS